MGCPKCKSTLVRVNRYWLTKPARREQVILTCSCCDYRWNSYARWAIELARKQGKSWPINQVDR